MIERIKKIKTINKTIIYISFLLSIPIFLGLLYIFIFSVNIPYYDQWAIDIPIGIKFDSNDGSFFDLLKVHNDHRPIVPYLILIPIYLLSKFNMISTVLISYMIFIVSFLILLRIIIKKFNNLPISLSIGVILSFYYFNFSLLCSLLWPGTGLYYSLTPFFILLMFYFLDRNGLDVWFALSIIAAIGSFFSFSGGIFIWMGGLFVLCLKRGEYYAHKIILWIFSTFIVIYINYFLLIPHIRYGSGGFSAYSENILEFLYEPLRNIIHLISACGSNITYDVNYVIPAGIILSVILGITILINRKTLDLDNTAIWYGLIINSYITIFALVLLRSEGYSIFIPHFRHFPSTYLLLIGISVLVYQYTNFNSLLNFLKNKSFLHFHEIIKNPMPLIAIIVTLIIIISTASHQSPGINFGITWFKEKSGSLNELKTDSNLSDDLLMKMVPEELDKSWGPVLVPQSVNYFRENARGIYDISQTGYINNLFINRIRELFIPNYSYYYSEEFLKKEKSYSQPVNLPFGRSSNNIEFSFDSIQKINITYPFFYVEGWAYSPSLSNDNSTTYLVLTNKEKNIIYSTEPIFREDVNKYLLSKYQNIPNNLGFKSKIQEKEIPSGDWCLGILIQNESSIDCSYSEKMLPVE